MEFDFSGFMIPIIVAFCYAVGYSVKKSEKIDDNWIPTIVFLTGIAVGVLSYFFKVDGFTPSSILMGVLYGGVSGFASVGLNQWFKQKNKGR